jgi:hypothetical protein
VEFIDDHPVVAHRVRFRNRVDVAEAHSDLVKDDMVVVWLMRTRCEPPQYHPVTKDAEERYRFNIQNVQGAVPLEGQLRDQALAYIEHGNAQGYLDLEVPKHPEALFDPSEYGPGAAENQIAEFTKYLDEIGELRDDETPVEALRRIVEGDQGAERHELPPQIELPLSPGDVETLGSIYGDHPPPSRAIIEQAFGAP